MARPKAAEQPATAKMQNAFWELLEEKPYDKITVSDVTRASGLNRTAFYYHYANIAELADDAIASIYEDTELVEFITRLIQKPDDINPYREYHRFIDIPQYQHSVHKVSLITGPHGSTALAKQLRNFIIDIWTTLIGVDRQRLNPGQQLIVDFASNGILGVLSNAGTLFNTEGIQWVARTHLPETVSHLINSLPGITEAQPESYAGRAEAPNRPNHLEESDPAE